MSTWTLIQVVFDIFAALGFFVIIMRMNRAPKDDPRLSRGLQLLQSKIAVLEDLSDRTETQANQLSAILEQKCREVQAKVQIAEQHVHEIRVSMDRSLEVAKIFQDKIPHQEIIERQNTLKYVQAARLAHQGKSADEIAKEIDLPKGEIEFIAKVNRDQLMFNEDQLPEWARGQQTLAPTPMAGPEPFALGHATFVAQNSPTESQAQDDGARMRTEIELAERQRLVENLSRLQSEMHNLDMQLARETVTRDLSTAFEAPKVEMGPMQKLGEEFRKACEEADHENNRNSLFPPVEQLTSIIPQIFAPVQQVMAQAANVSAQINAPQPAMAAAPAPTPVQDPVLARAAAQAKVQAALAQGKPAAQPSATSTKDEALAAARAAAQSVAVTNVTPAAKPASPVIKRVEFPKIDSPVR